MSGATSATQRKNKQPSSVPSSITSVNGSSTTNSNNETITTLENITITTPLSPNTKKLKNTQPPPNVAVATVVRRRCGTSPFDANWLNLDCCGLFCAGLTYGLHIYGCYAVCAVLIPPWMSYEVAGGDRQLSIMGKLNATAFCLVAFMACISHFYAMTTDPGAVPPDATPLPQITDIENVVVSEPPRGRRLCRRCNAFKPQRAHHCSICQRCIIKMDHHCPWVNNCVGIGNHKFFLLFIFYTFLSCMYSLTLLVYRFVVCLNLLPGGRKCLDEPTDLLPLVGLVVEAMLFGLFTSCMMIDQWDVVMTNVTHIDRLKGENHRIDPYGKNKSSIGINEVFGSRGKPGFHLDWLVPFIKASFPVSINDEVMGFCIPCGAPNRSDMDSSQGRETLWS